MTIRRLVRWAWFVVLLTWLVAVIAAWVRSHVVSDRFVWAKNTAIWPDGTREDVPVGSDGYHEWYRQRRYPLVHMVGITLYAGHGRLYFSGGVNDCAMRTEPGGEFYAWAHKGVPDHPGKNYFHETHALRDINFDAFTSRRYIDPLVADLQFAGVSFKRAKSRPLPVTRDYFDLIVPFWLPATVLALLTFAAAPFRLRRRPRGLCRNCGYDLRASPDRCPECGTPVARANTANGPLDREVP